MVSIEVAQKQKVLLIPANAVQNGQVTLLRDGKKVKIKVIVGLMDSESAEITQGEIKQGDTVFLRAN